MIDLLVFVKGERSIAPKTDRFRASSIQPMGTGHHGGATPAVRTLLYALAGELEHVDHRSTIRQVLEAGMGMSEDWAAVIGGAGGIDELEGPAVEPTLLLLGEIKLAGVEWVTTAQQLSLVSFLVCVGPASRRAIVEALWGGQRISDHRVSNLLAELRGVVGRRHFPDPVNGRYQVLGIDTDVQRFQRAVTSICMTERRPELNDSTWATLEASSLRAVSTIGGVPFTTQSSRYWTWLDDCPGLISGTEEHVGAGVLALAELLLRDGRVSAAIATLERGLVACPLDEELTINLVEAYRSQGRIRHAQRLVAGWEGRVRRLGCGEPSARPRNRLAGVQATSIGSAVTTRLPL